MDSKEKISLVLLPGMDGTGKLFAPLIALLPSYISPIVIIFPTTIKLSYQELATLVQAQIPPDGPYILLGESFSGPIAIALAANANVHLKGLILTCTFAINPRQFLSKFRILVPCLPINAWSRPVLNQLLLANFDSPALSQYLYDVVSQVPPAVMRYRLDEVMQVDETVALRKITQPILYLQAKNDYLVPPTAAQTILKLAQHAQIVALDAPHLLLQVATKAAVVQIEYFINHTLKI
ncbi:MAG: alpha/beta hydrolase [Methylophilaceae bacterium]